MRNVQIVPEKGKSELEKLTENIDEDPAFQHVVHPAPPPAQEQEDNATSPTGEGSCRLRLLHGGEGFYLYPNIGRVVSYAERNGNYSILYQGKVGEQSVAPTPAANLAMAILHGMVDEELGTDPSRQRTRNLLVSALSRFPFSHEGAHEELMRGGREGEPEHDFAYLFDNALLAWAFAVAGEHYIDEEFAVYEGVAEHVTVDMAVPTDVKAFARWRVNVQSGSPHDHWVSEAVQSTRASAVFAAYLATSGHDDFARQFVRGFVSDGVIWQRDHGDVVLMKKGSFRERMDNVDLAATAGLALAHYALGDARAAGSFVRGIHEYGRKENFRCSNENYELYTEYWGGNQQIAAVATNALIAMAFMAESFAKENDK